MQKHVVIGSDHAGFAMKEFLIGKLKEAGIDVADAGTYSEASADFSPIALAVAESVASDAKKLGILLCGTGIGMSIMANKVNGVRAALAHDLFSARATREHNDSNILCLGARIIAPAMAWELTRAWLSAEFLGGRHEQRLEFIRSYEQRRDEKTKEENR